MKDEITPCCESEWWINLVISFALVAFASITSGLSLGLLSHSKVDLEVLIKSGVPRDQKNAAKVLPIVKNEILLLCTLLIAKSLVMEALPIFLDRILPFWSAILVSMSFVVAFAEVIPQAICSRYGLSLGAKFTLFVQVLQFILFPVSYPVSKVLDWLLGKNHSAILRRAELKTYVDLHGIKAGKGGDLTDDETTIITGAMNMTQKTARDAMTPISRTFSLDINSKLDSHTMGIIASKGHSRVPIYLDDPANIIGLILIKNLIFYHPEDETPIKDMTIRRILRVCDNWPLYDVLKLFRKGHGHMAVVVKSETDTKITSKRAEDGADLTSINIIPDSEPTETDGIGINPPLGEKELLNNSSVYDGDGEIQSHSLDDGMKKSHLSLFLNKWEQERGQISNEELESLKGKYIDEEVIGIVTMEDVLEELLQEEILDETDQHVEIHKKIRVKFLSSRRSSSASTGLASVSQLYWRTPATSPSSYYHTPVISSPIPSYIPSPYTPKLSSSPAKPSLSFSRSIGSLGSSSSSHQFPSISRHFSSLSRERF
ncbi:DUF21 domain-containing At5g52790-like [Olea europaea subsp. europaea]|uniref:DUF21 domain-containing At5g52790-like n=2 Tax=Olea europaea subsp. europaea TaxID=158383 RepID=A0A8S0TYJ7_OLEEU|nr:DUF21 domain-containing At5g52790-like [Olea europaea subsp. europaea]